MYIDSWRLRSFELSLEGERVLKIQSESNEELSGGVPSASSQRISTTEYFTDDSTGDVAETQ